MKRSVRRFVEIFLACSLVSIGGVDLLYNTISPNDLGRSIVFENSEDSRSNSCYLVQHGGLATAHENSRFGSRTHQRTDYQTLLAFRESVGNSWKSTVQIIVKSRQVAMGAIVHHDGWIVTKSSEIPDKFEVKLFDGTKAGGTVTARHTDMDLALIKVDRNSLQPIVWNTDIDIPVGGWLISPDTRQVPMTIGVLSVANRNVRAEKPVLGVRLGIPVNGEQGASIESVVSGGGADRAGIQVGDVIQKVDGIGFSSRDDVLTHLRGLKAGQILNLGIIRDSRELSLNAQMMDLSNSLFDSTEMEVNGQISARATGFQNVMQHDTVLLPHQCGGPVVDIDGRAVGLNIARNGRVASFAYHAKNLEPAIKQLLQASGGPQDIQVEHNAVVQASATSSEQGAVSIPTSVPTSIQVELLKPDIILPAQL